jgi:hypothetical protein
VAESIVESAQETDLCRLGGGKTVNGRIGELLVALNGELETDIDGKARFPLLLTHAELGAMVGSISRDSVSSFCTVQADKWILQEESVVFVPMPDCY